MIVLGVETSCDETAVAIVRDGRDVIASVVYSQIKLHRQFGGVVPEVASRKHVQKILSVFDEVFRETSLKPSEIDLVAVTSTPGLVGSLFVGINAAHTFSYIHNIPCIDVNHLHGHIYANFIEEPFSFPLLALIVSGGHTELVLMKEHYSFIKIGETLDDAVGEAYDKVGRVMGLAYPAGPHLDKLAREGTPTYKLPLIYLDKGSYNFSFSGLKSAVLNLVNKHKQKGEDVNIPNLAASFQEAVVKVLVDKTIQAAIEYKVKHIVVAGGVAANSGLRAEFAHRVVNYPEFKLTYPSLKYCTDNAVMIAVAGYFNYLQNKKNK